jgi:hypothetical protein
LWLLQRLAKTTLYSHKDQYAKVSRQFYLVKKSVGLSIVAAARKNIAHLSKGIEYGALHSEKAGIKAGMK